MSMTGKSLAHYDIAKEIGKGGMGVVYQAKDQKLGRDVAIKVLPEEFAKDAERVARFQREAKLLASLNHPNIAAIYGLEESEGVHFLVLELIEGDTLADRIKTGAIPVEEALKLALQIAEALEAAHEKGVIHRDLKPANIKITPEGKIKVLDFGLAKAFAGEQEQMNLSNSPTLSDMATQQGIILGTAAYMSPEQARGNPVDKRADIWAFGVVLFEMLVGRQIFSENTVSDTLASVLKTEPKWDSLPKNLHPRIRLMLESCLEKDVKSRSSGIGEVRSDIQKVLADPSGVFSQQIQTLKPRKKLRLGIPWVAAIAILCLIIAGVAVWILKPIPKPQVVRSEYVLPEDQQFFRGSSGLIPIAISPDGSQFAYSTTNGIYIRSVNELDARPIPGANEDAQSLFFSPDGQSIGYFSLADRKLKSISVSGGAPVDLCDAGIVKGATWHEDNTIVYTDRRGVCRLPAEGGIPEVLLERTGIAGGQLLPGGKSVKFIDVSSQPYKTVVQSLETGDQKVIYDKGDGFYSPTGHFLYRTEDSMFAVPFDLNKLEFAGKPVSVMTEGSIGDAISDSGTYVYVPGTRNWIGTRNIVGRFGLPINTLVWVDRQGNVEDISAPPDEYRNPRISPDGTKVALTVGTEEGSSDIYILDLDSETPRRLTFIKNSTDPLWTPDSQRIVFVAGDADKTGIYWKAADGTGKEELLASMSDGGGPPWSLSSDGKTLVTTKGTGTGSLGGFREISAAMLRQMMGGGMRGRGSGPPEGPPGFGRGPRSEGSSTREEMEFSVDIGTLSMEGDHEWESLLNLDGWVIDLQISPDGKWMVYSLTGSEQAGIHVHPFPDVDDGQWQVYTSDAIGCLWSPNDRELFYTSFGSLIAVEVETVPTFKFGKSEVLFNPRDIGLNPGSIHSRSLDISPDGKRFLFLKDVATTDDESQAEEPTEEGPRKIIIVTNWFEELKDRVPVD